jgi:hypothetical protein
MCDMKGPVFFASPPADRLRAGATALAGALIVLATVGVASAAEPEAIAAPGVDAPPAPPRWSRRAELSDSVYRWSASRGALDLGIRFDASARGQFATDARSRLDNAGPLVQPLPALSLGLHSIDAPPSSLLKQLGGSDSGLAYTHRVGIEWKPAQSELLFLRQGLGVRLSGDDRLTMRLRKGTLGLYMKRDF